VSVVCSPSKSPSARSANNNDEVHDVHDATTPTISRHALASFYLQLESANAVLTERQATELRESCTRFLDGYASMAKRAIHHNEMLFPIKPKHHMLDHLADRMVEERGMLDTCNAACSARAR